MFRLTELMSSMFLVLGELVWFLMLTAAAAGLYLTDCFACDLATGITGTLLPCLRKKSIVWFP